MRRFSLIFLMFLLSIASVNCVEYSLLATVTINHIYDLSLEVDVITERVLAGDNVTVFVELNKTDLTENGKEITVDLTYEILKPNMKVVDSGYAGEMKVKEYNETTIQVPTQIDAKPGKYILKINATHPQAYGDSDSDEFWIKKKIVLFGLMLDHWNFWDNLTRSFNQFF